MALYNYSMKHFAALFLALSLLTSSSDNQISLTARVNKEKISLDTTLTLTISLRGNFRQTPKIEMPKLDDFEIISNISQSNFNLKAGTVESRSELIYILLPKKEGKLNIGQAKINYQGREYKTEVIQVEVGPPKAGPLKKSPPKKEIPIRKGQEIVL
jgi:hypothetical protein